MTETQTKETEDEYEVLLSQINHPVKLAFLEQYPKFRIVNETCRALGISDRTVRAWRKQDETFNAAFTALKKEILEDLIARHEKNIDDVAFDKITPAQSRIFGSLVKLRAYDPDRYREKTVAEHRISGNVTVKMAIPRPGEIPEISVDKPLEIESGIKQTAESGENEGN
jgi:transposase-like protein